MMPEALSFRSFSPPALAAALVLLASCGKREGNEEGGNPDALRVQARESAGLPLPEVPETERTMPPDREIIEASSLSRTLVLSDSPPLPPDGLPEASRRKVAEIIARVLEREGAALDWDERLIDPAGETDEFDLLEVLLGLEDAFGAEISEEVIAEALGGGFDATKRRITPRILFRVVEVALARRESGGEQPAVPAPAAPE